MQTNQIHEKEQNFGYKQELNRVLTLKDLVIYGMVFMVPIAPMGIYGFVSKQSHGMVPLVYLVGVIVMLFTAISYSRMSKVFPIAGSVYSYVQRGLNPHVGFVTGWVVLIDYILFPALNFAFTGTWMNSLVPGIPVWVWVLGFVLFSTVVNMLGISFAAKTNFVLLAIEVIALLIFIGFAVNYVFIEGHGYGGFSLAPLFQIEHVNLGFIATATSLAALSFLGFDAISTLSEETKNPQKTISHATIISLLSLGLIFIIQTYLAALVHPDYSNLDPEMGFFNISKEAGGNFLYYLLIIVSAIGSIANALAAQSAISRILFSMSRDRLLPFSPFFAKTHPRFKVPLNAILFVGSISFLVAITTGLEMIVKFVNFGAVTSFMVLNLTVFVYFFIKLKQRRGKQFLYNFVFPIIGFGCVTFVWFGFDHLTFLFGFGWMAIGIVIGFIKSKGYKEVPASLMDM